MQHLDEGMVHAWLDGALSADEAARVERHAAECADCAALVAEARGLVAGASRILSALDEATSVVPLGMSRPLVIPQERAIGMSEPLVIPQERAKRASVGISSPGRSRWTRPAALAAAAGVVLMAGSAIVLNRTGGRASVGAFVDSVQPAAGTTEESVPLPGVAAEAPVGAAPEAARGDGRGAAGAATSSRLAVPVPPPAPPRQAAAGSGGANRRAFGLRAPAAPVPAAGRAANAANRDSGATLEPVVPTAVSSVAQKAAAAPSRASTLNEQASTQAAAPPVAAPAAAADAAAQQRLMAPERAQGQRAAVGRARSEELPTADAAGSRSEVRVDTVFTRGRVDTIQVAAGLRPRGAVASMTPVFPVTGCYRIIEGGLRDTLTLSRTGVWSGTAEKRFRATIPGTTGHWSQPPSGDIHIEIGGALVNARIDPSTGDLVGRVFRGGPSEPFLARRCR
jgi:Putative zinc-finger